MPTSDGRVMSTLDAAGIRAALRSTVRGVADPVTERDRERRRIAVLCLPFALLATVAGVYPLLEVARISVSTEQYRTVGVTLATYETLLTDPYYHRVALNSVVLAGSTTVFSVGVAVPIAHALEKYDLRYNDLLVTLVSFPISLPGIVAAFMIITLFGNSGLFTNAAADLIGAESTAVAFATSVPGLFLAYVYSMVPRAVLLLRGAYAEVNEAAEEAALALGASPLQTFRRVTLPQIRPGIVGALVLTFRTGLAIFGTLVVIQAVLVWTLQISRELASGFDIQLAGAMATVYFAFTFGFTALALRYTSAEVGL